MGPLAHSKQRYLQPLEDIQPCNGTTVPEQADIVEEAYSHSPHAGRDTMLMSGYT